MSKKTTTIVEEDITPAEKHDEAVLEALSGDEAVTIDPQKLDEPAEEKKEEIKVEETPKEEPKVEPEEKKEEVIKEIEAAKEDQTPEQKDEYDKFVEDYTKQHGKAPEWKQVADFLKDQVKADLQAEVEQEEKQEAETQKAQEEEQQKLNDSLNKDWDEQLDELVKAGKIPSIKDPNNNEVQVITNAEGKEIERIPLEPGKKARYDLFKAMYVASEDRIANKQKPLTNLKEIFYEHYGKKQPAGADAPIAGARKSVSQTSPTFNYTDIHNVSTEQLLEEARNSS